MAFPDLLFDFSGYLVNGRIKVAFTVLGKQVRTAHRQAYGTAELFFGRARVVVFQCNASIYGALVKMIEFLQAAEHMIFDGLGQGDIVRRKNQFHAPRWI
jgi:hypothetical protein